MRHGAGVAVGWAVAVGVGAAGVALAVGAAVGTAVPVGSTVALGKSSTGSAVDAINFAGSTTNVGGIWAATGSAQPTSSKLPARKILAALHACTAIFYSLFPPCLSGVAGIIRTKCHS
ncbi:MAG: hypothetical protein DWI63_00635 [Chloroflexi bacterium]|nr:MAG: hypothetical protein DWI63_00635 [Chloroflexota bacterium]